MLIHFGRSWEQPLGKSSTDIFFWLLAPLYPVKRSTSWWWLQLGGKIDWRFRRVPNFPEFMCFPFWKDRLGPPWSCTCCAVLTVVSPHRKLGTRCVWRRSDIIDAPGHSHLPCPERTGPSRITQNPGTAWNVAAETPYTYCIPQSTSDQITRYMWGICHIWPRITEEANVWEGFPIKKHAVVILRQSHRKHSHGVVPSESKFRACVYIP